ncbi:MAG: hypothetical protein JWN84_2479 [Nocardioides sp.]|nr:hypothetical protein [Nocardioides sp.]
MDTADIVWIVVAALVVLAIIALVLFLLKKRKEKQRHQQLAHAEHLRGEAASRTPHVETAAERAQIAEVEADKARARAAEADRVAADAHRDLVQEQAAQEDVVRRADELDPRVDTRSKDYHPVTGPDMKSSTVDDGVVDDTTRIDDGRHRA